MLYNDVMPHTIEYDNHTCLLCGYHCKNRKSLGMHLCHRHPGETIESYVTRFFFPDGPPLCACGKCGQPVEWHRSRYSFNDYVNGHNKAGYCRDGYQQTKEQIENRICSIRATYSGERAEGIKTKIGSAVEQAHQNDPEYRNALGNRMREAWQDPIKRAEMTATRKRVWAERYEELYARIFTEDFGRKISEANRRRDMKRTSAAERAFMDQLEALGFVVERDHWIHDPVTGSNKCYDARLATGELIEFDGSFWHGLDRPAEDLCEVQLLNAANDVLKNAIAERRGQTLLRFAEGTDLSGVATLEDLRERAYLIVG